MPLPPLIERALIRLTDTVYDRRAQPVPQTEALKRCRIISHRGVHDNHRVMENTMAAFQGARKAGVWGIEFDLRWTRDFEPVVCHDQDLFRLFGREEKINTFDLEGLKRALPAIPTLNEVVRTFGGDMHLMIEVKRQPWMNRSRQVARLADIMAPLTPSEDYHLLTLHPEALPPMDGIPLSAHVGIAMYRPGKLSRWIQRNRWGGLCGHYLLMRRRIIRTHHQCRQGTGTGYIRSRNCLFREINRGVDWIFSNHADRLQRMIEYKN